MDLSGSWQYLETVARSRLAHNQTIRQVTEYGEGIEILGAAGELAARRFLGVSEDLHTGFDRGVDIEYCGITIDVKTTVLTPRFNFRKLQWPMWKRIKSEIVLMAAVEPIRKIGVIVGFAYKAEVMNAPINEKAFTPCHEILVNLLHPAWEILQKGVQRTTL